MSRYRDINKLSKEDLFLEQYSLILKGLHDLVNTNDLDHVKFLKLDLSERFNYLIKLKIKLIERN